MRSADRTPLRIRPAPTYLHVIEVSSTKQGVAPGWRQPQSASECVVKVMQHRLRAIRRPTAPQAATPRRSGGCRARSRGPGERRGRAGPAIADIWGNYGPRPYATMVRPRPAPTTKRSTAPAHQSVWRKTTTSTRLPSGLAYSNCCRRHWAETTGCQDCSAPSRELRTVEQRIGRSFRTTCVPASARSSAEGQWHQCSDEARAVWLVHSSSARLWHVVSRMETPTGSSFDERWCAVQELEVSSRRRQAFGTTVLRHRLGRTTLDLKRCRRERFGDELDLRARYGEIGCPTRAPRDDRDYRFSFRGVIFSSEMSSECSYMTGI